MQPVTPSSTDVDVTFRVLDSTTFLPYESLSSATPGLALWYQKGAAGSVTAITEGDHTNLTDAHSDGKLKHIDDGWYRLSLPDAAVPTAEHEVTTFGGTATGYVILGGALVGKPAEVVSASLVTAIWGGITATAARVIADHVLRRSWASASASADGDTLSFRSLLGAVAKLVNRVGINGATLTVYQDDDTTALGEQTLTSDAAAEPIVSVDTVG